jgi:hypothetical protein
MVRSNPTPRKQRAEWRTLVLVCTRPTAVDAETAGTAGTVVPKGQPGRVQGIMMVGFGRHVLIGFCSI